MIAHTTNNGRREELHGSVQSAVKSMNRWNQLGFHATMEWHTNLDDSMVVVIVKE